MRIDDVDAESLDRVIAGEQRGVVIDFWGTWCQPCRSLRTHLERLADDHARTWRIVAVHVDEQVDLVERYEVQSTPTLVYIRNGSELFRTAGAVTPSAVSAALTEHAA